MRSQRTFRRIIFLITLASLLFVAALPQQGVMAEEDVIKLTIANKSDQDVWLKLDGPAYYYLHVKAHETKSFTPQRNVYNFKLYSCGTSVTGEMELLWQKTLDVPICGTKSNTGPGSSQVIYDGGDLLNLVKMTFKNDSNYRIMVILDGTSVFVFSFASGQSKDYTIPFGEYTYTQYGCGIKTGKFLAHFHKIQEFTCP